MPATMASGCSGRTRTFRQSKWPGSTRRLLLVERFFRAAKDLLETRPIFHKFDATITGHIFVSFLALLLVHELEKRLKRKGLKLEWADVVRDLGEVREVEVRQQGKHYILTAAVEGGGGPGIPSGGGGHPPTGKGGPPWCQDRCPGAIMPLRTPFFKRNCRR